MNTALTTSILELSMVNARKAVAKLDSANAILDVRNGERDTKNRVGLIDACNARLRALGVRTEPMGFPEVPLHSIVEVTLDEQPGDIATCPRCAKTYGVELVAKVFGYRNMTSTSKGGVVKTTRRRQAYCKKCRGLAPLTPTA